MSVPRPTRLLIALAALFFPWPALQAEEIVRVTLTGAPVDQSAWLGASTRSPDRYMGDDPQWLALVKPMRLAWLRYPGGTVANFWDWRKGNFIPGGNPERPGQVQRSPDFTLETFARLIQATGAVPVFCLNMITDTLESQMEMLAHAEALGLPIRIVELGNEINSDHPSNRKRFPTATDYGEECARWINALTNRFSHVRVGVVGGRRTPGWNEAVLKAAPEAHALILHPYIRSEWAIPRARHFRASPEDAMRKQAEMLTREETVRAFLGLSNLSMRSIVEVADQYPGIPLWLTEFNLADHMSPAGGSWLHGLLLAHYLLLMMEDPRIEMAIYHLLSGERSYSAVYHRAWPRPWLGDETTPYTLSPAGAVLSLISSELGERPVVERLAFDPNPVWPWSRRAGHEDFPALIGYRLSARDGAGTPRWLVANLSPHAQTFVWPDQAEQPVIIRVLHGEPASQQYAHKTEGESLAGVPPYSVTLWGAP